MKRYLIYIHSPRDEIKKNFTRVFICDGTAYELTNDEVVVLKLKYGDIEIIERDEYFRVVFHFIYSFDFIMDEMIRLRPVPLPPPPQYEN